MHIFEKQPKNDFPSWKRQRKAPTRKTYSHYYQVKKAREKGVGTSVSICWKMENCIIEGFVGAVGGGGKTQQLRLGSASCSSLMEIRFPQLQATSALYFSLLAFVFGIVCEILVSGFHSAPTLFFLPVLCQRISRISRNVIIMVGPATWIIWQQFGFALNYVMFWKRNFIKLLSVCLPGTAI